MEIDVIENSLKDSKYHFIINPILWEAIAPDVRETINVDWQEIKFYKDDKKPNEMINVLPNDKGGIYVFVVKPNIIPDTHLYVMYIGRARHTASQNLRKRCKEYYNESRPKVKRLLRHWWKYLYIRYLPLEDNDLIDRIEKELINAIIPPCNDRIPDKTIQEAINAFE